MKLTVADMNALPTLTDTARKIVREHLGVESHQVTPEAHFVRDLGADSLDRIEIAMDVEDAFDIVLIDAEIDEVVTFGDLLALIEKKCAWPTTG